jgi:hypothetical protein
LARGFQYGTQPGALMIGWNGSHTAVTLPDGTNVSSGEGGGVRIGGQGAYQRQFTHHMYLPMSPEATDAVNAAINGEAPADAPVEAPIDPPIDAPGLAPEPAPGPVEGPIEAPAPDVPADQVI